MKNFDDFRVGVEKFELKGQNLIKQMRENSVAHFKFMLDTLLSQSLKEHNENNEEKLPQIVEINWEFMPESDDEGGLNYYPESVYVKIKEGEEESEVSIHELGKEYSSYENFEIPFPRTWTSKYDDERASVAEVVVDLLFDFSNELYDVDMEKIRMDEVL